MSMISFKRFTPPNAPHIRRVLDHAVGWPQRWRHVRHDMIRAEAIAEVTKLLDTDTVLWCRRAIAVVTIPPAWEDCSYQIHRSVDDAVKALVAWDDCAYILDLPPATVRTLAGSGIHAAALLLPAAIALNGDHSDPFNMRNYYGDDDGSDGTTTEGAGPTPV